MEEYTFKYAIYNVFNDLVEIEFDVSLSDKEFEHLQEAYNLDDCDGYNFEEYPDFDNTLFERVQNEAIENEIENIRFECDEDVIELLSDYLDMEITDIEDITDNQLRDFLLEDRNLRVCFPDEVME